MTRLVGLKMQGVRSIAEEPHVINFLDPLTIIQGENGTGKTTIIECLNYITTGTLPAGRLVTFIHNNKLSKKKRVDALIQLQFTDFRGNDCTATKRMYAAQSTGNKLTTKSDEFTLKVTEPDGTTRSESVKVTNFNQRIESLFGVPAAILQHVIFCHQEESTWPLGEPKELKTKFDAIFEVERFVKVMDSIKKNAKEFENELKVVCAELPHLERQMQTLGAVFMQLEENTRKISKAREFLKTKEKEKTELSAEYNKLKAEHEAMQTLEREIEFKKREIEINRDTVANVPDAVKDEPQRTKEELVNELNSIKNSVEYNESNEAKIRSQKEKTKLESKLPSLQSQQNALQTRINKIESKKMLLENMLKQRDEIIIEGIASFRLKSQPSDFANVLETEIKKANDGLTAFVNSKETQRNDLNKKASAIKEKIATHTNVDKMKRAECTKLKNQIQRLEKELSNSNNSNDKVTQIQNEIAERTEKITEIQGEHAKSFDAMKQKLFELDVFPNVSSEVGEVESLASQLVELSLANDGSFKEFICQSIGEKAVLSENTRRDLAEFKSQYEEAENEMKQAFQAIVPLRKELKAVEEQLASFAKSLEAERGSLTKRIHEMQSTAKRLKEIEAKLKQHNDENEADDADECRKKMNENSKKMNEIRNECNRLTMVMSECDNRSQVIRELEDRIRFSNTFEVIKQLEADIVEIQSKITKPAKDLQNECQQLAVKINALNVEFNKRLGARDAYQKNERELRNQLKGENINEIKKRLKEKVIERISLETSVQDLKNLAKIMDDSIIQYHTQKMEEINNILNDLWPRVYKGNDIESIQIKSQPVSGGDKRKSYDYSVIMIVDQVEIEMRDRCSAGQKMLASILIRIALAEVFGGNCPILALDEPTTNLDASKVENMGTILKDLLETYQNHENRRNHLQLLVITHDKRLVEHLFTACRPDYVYGLSKDENGSSRIKVHHFIGDVNSNQEDLNTSMY